jgi:hypothetical protein
LIFIITGYGPDMEKLRHIANNILLENEEIDFRGYVTRDEYETLILASDIKKDK